jgi:GT2 family glycosyltransferase
VILNWNGISYLRQFLPALMAENYPNMELIVGDNASTDDSIAFLKENYPEVRIIRNDQNYGFAGGYNKVLESVDSDYYVLLNSDVEVSPGWIEPVIRMMEGDPSIVAAQPKILSHRDKTKFEYAGAGGGLIDMLGYPFCRGRLFDTIEDDLGQYDIPAEVFWASGAALFIRKSAWDEAGGFDDDFFAHMEEIDLCWRLKNKGYRIMYCPDSVVYHVGGGTLSAESPHKVYLNFRNNLVLLQKNLPLFTASWVIFCRLWLDLISLMKFLSEGKPQNARAVNRAHTYFFRNLFKNARKARTISIFQFNPAGLYESSIVWQYFVLGKKTFKEL